MRHVDNLLLHFGYRFGRNVNPRRLDNVSVELVEWSSAFGVRPSVTVIRVNNSLSQLFRKGNGAYTNNETMLHSSSGSGNELNGINIFETDIRSCSGRFFYLVR